MQRAIVLSVIAVLGTASYAVAQDAIDAQPDDESTPAAESLDPPLAPIGAPAVQPAAGKRRPAAKPARPKKEKGGTLPRRDPNRDRKEFQRKLALAQSLHTTERCGAAYPMYLDLQTQQPEHPDVIWGLGECGAVTGAFPELAPAMRRQRLLDAKAAYERYAAIEKRAKFTAGKKSRVQLARDRASQLDVTIAALPAPPVEAVAVAADAAVTPVSAPEPREFPRHKGATTLCGMQAFWDPSQGLNPGFAVELFVLLHADPELRVTIWLPSDWNDRARRLFQATNELWLKDQGFRERHGLTSTVLREYASYERRIGFIGTPGVEQQPSRVMLHHPNGIDVAIQRCDSARGALAWAVEEKTRQGAVAVGVRMEGQDRSVALAVAGAAPAPAADPPPAAPPPVAAAIPVAPAPVTAAPPAAPPPVAAIAAAAAASPQEPSLGHAQELARKRDLVGALAELEELLKRHPDDSTLQEHWVLWRAASGQCDGVLPVYERIAERSQRPEVHLAGSECADRGGQVRAHLFALERYIRTALYVGDPEIFYGLAEGFATLGDRQRAGNHFQRFLHVAPPTHPKRYIAEMYLADTVKLHVACLTSKGIVRPRAVQVGGQWVSELRLPPNYRTIACE
ncbi:hypothetical protein HY635_04240 [Candidatus Uhrbacteria bacterium]|nr:hypothetical protein [Candidatus Uhrbacteria bacterium]